MGNNQKTLHTLVGCVLAVILVLSAPMFAGAATSTAGTTITATIAATISMTTSTNVAIALTPTTGGVVSSASDAVSVSTNNTAGYNLTVSSSDASTNLTSGANTIGAHAGTQAAPTALAVNKWGYRVVNVGGFGATAYTAETNNGSSSSTWAGMPAAGAANTLKSTATTAANDITTVWYGVKVTTAQPAGAYTETVTYTATTN